MMQVECFQCSKLLEFDSVIGRSEECSCGYDVRCCKNCRFYDERSHQQCIESQADKVAEKERGNFCGYFTPAKIESKIEINHTASKPKSGLEGELQAFLSSKRKDPFQK